ncbi:hypothetical protein Micbo1qcDRAFT_168802, partial [Microdochium bolleyi]
MYPRTRPGCTGPEGPPWARPSHFITVVAAGPGLRHVWHRPGQPSHALGYQTPL